VPVSLPIFTKPGKPDRTLSVVVYRPRHDWIVRHEATGEAGSASSEPTSVSKGRSCEDYRRWRRGRSAASRRHFVAWDHYAARTSVTMMAGVPPIRSSGGEPFRYSPARFRPAAKSCRDCVRFRAELPGLQNHCGVRFGFEPHLGSRRAHCGLQPASVQA
jgi:hypothetical protein